MIKIIGFYKGRREVLDYTNDRQEADFLHAEYALAMREWKIEKKEGAAHKNFEQVANLRNQGRTNGEIAKLLKLDRHTIEVYAAQLANQGIIDRRQPGARETKAERNLKIAQARRDGKTVPQIMSEFGLSFFNVRGLLYKMRKRGQL